LPARIRLKGGKQKNLPFVIADNEVHHPVAKIADTIKEDYGFVGNHPAKLGRESKPEWSCFILGGYLMDHPVNGVSHVSWLKPFGILVHKIQLRPCIPGKGGITGFSLFKFGL
jgi:hypothetical protein